MPSQDKYTDPELREQVKEEIKEGDKVGAPGQWSARKAQMMASEYKKRGGDYTTSKDEQDKSQKNLSKWTDEEWQTKEGSGHAKQSDGTEKRYLPKKAWEDMSEGEKEKTEKAKVEGGKQGKQYVGNTDKAKKSKKKASDEAEEEDDEESSASEKEAGANDDDAEQEDGSASDNGESSPSGGEKKKTRGEKRGRPRKSESSPNKRPKNDARTGKQNGSSKGFQDEKDAKNGDTVGSKHDKAEPPAEQGSNDRLPKEGQHVHWKALPGYVEGEVVEIVNEEKEVEGKQVKGSKGDPRIVLRSKSTGKICVHKPEAVFFD